LSIISYHQKVEGGKITYVAEEAEQWFDNQFEDFMLNNYMDKINRTP